MPDLDDEGGDDAARPRRKRPKTAGMRGLTAAEKAMIDGVHFRGIASFPAVSVLPRIHTMAPM